MTLKEYINNLSKLFQTGKATELSYRASLIQYIQEIIGENFLLINESTTQDCGKPDILVLRSRTSLPIFYVETKDINDSDLDGNKEHKEQFDRYKNALEYIVFTDYLDFHFYEHGNFVEKIRLGEVVGNKIISCEESEQEFNRMILSLSHSMAKSITKAKDLAEIMASKARLLRFITLNTMNSIVDGYSNYSDNNLRGLYSQFKEYLIKDLDYKQFADMYAQTIVYGLFAARLNDSTPENFSRSEALSLIPKSNPFLRNVFENVAGNDLDERISWIVDDLVETFAATDVQKIMEQYGQNTQRNDPMVHFYEDFLEKYDNKLRKQMGVWYTPKPIVSFIVRSIDKILKRDFGLKDGLADRSKTTYSSLIDQSRDKRTKDKKKHETKETLKVQILDPATGTGTFLATTIQQIYQTICKNNNQGIWQEYVEKELKPRLNGFELMVAPYTIAHIKLGMVLKATGYKESGNQRLKVFLTNSLEEPSDSPRDLFNAISFEANDSDIVKRDMPVMVILGNPPYNGSSSNKGKWILNLLDDYKREPGGKIKLNERNPKWINNDYVKFIRLAQEYITKNKSGILGYITPHHYLSNPTYRGVRWNILTSFDKIYVLDLHGDIKEDNLSPEGEANENVFNIKEGTCISLFIKTGKKRPNENGKVFYFDIWGKRESKYDFLMNNDIQSVRYKEIKPFAPYYIFTSHNIEKDLAENMGFKINELFNVYSMGIATAKDSIVVQNSVKEVKQTISDFIHLTPTAIKEKYHISKETNNWSIKNATKDLSQNLSSITISKYTYRPFDYRYVAYTGTSNGYMCRPRADISNCLIKIKNIALCCIRVSRDYKYTVFVVDSITDKTLLSSKDNCSIFPLYSYLNCKQIPNFHEEIFKKICSCLGFEPTPEQLFDYIYAVLHCPSYREEFKESLKIDFPRIPYPADNTKFNELASKGHELVELHLMKDTETWSISSGFPEGGSNEVTDLKFYNERVYINETQYFNNVNDTVWNFYIGGYQPAQKWLKDRKGMKLSVDDIIHYERIIYALDNTERIMKEIDRIY